MSRNGKKLDQQKKRQRSNVVQEKLSIASGSKRNYSSSHFSPLMPPPMPFGRKSVDVDIGHCVSSPQTPKTCCQPSARCPTPTHLLTATCTAPSSVPQTSQNDRDVQLFSILERIYTHVKQNTLYLQALAKSIETKKENDDYLQSFNLPIRTDEEFEQHMTNPEKQKCLNTRNDVYTF